MYRDRHLGKLLSIFLLLSVFYGVSVVPDTLEIMSDELNRSFQKLQEQEEPPYFLSYEITEVASALVGGSFGEVNSENFSVNRYLDIDLRVGNFELDNTREVPGGGFFGGLMGSETATIPIEDEEALRTTLWYQTNSEYRTALTEFTRVKSATQQNVEAEDKSGDFSPAPPSEFSMEQVSLEGDLAVWGQKLREYTRPFAAADFILTNNAQIDGTVETRWFVNSEGSKVSESSPLYRLVIAASSKADDGMVMQLVKTFEASTPAKLFDDESIMVAVATMIDNLKDLRVAPLVDPYTGPAILSGRATGVLFHEILGHRLEGHRQKSEEEGQTFKKKIGELVLPENFSVGFRSFSSRLG